MLFRDHDLFIFDWDGTLSTSTLLVRATHVFKLRYNPDYIKRNSERFKAQMAAKMRAESDPSPLYRMMNRVYAMVANPKLKPGAVEIMERLKKRGKKTAIFSDSNRYRLFIETRTLGMLDRVDFVLSSDAVRSYKPNPAGIKGIIERFRIPKSRCVYIGDMAVEIFTARFAGIHSCSLADGLDPYFLLKSNKPDYIFRGTDSLLKALN